MCQRGFLINCNLLPVISIACLILVNGCSNQPEQLKVGDATGIEISLGSDPKIYDMKLFKKEKQGQFSVESTILLPPDFVKPEPIKTASFGTGSEKFALFNEKLKILETRSVVDEKKMIEEVDVFMGLPCENWFTHGGVMGVKWSYENSPDRYAQLDLGCHLKEIDEIRIMVYQQFDSVEKSIASSDWVENEPRSIDN